LWQRVVTQLDPSNDTPGILDECLGDFASTDRDMRPIFRGDSGDPAILMVGVMMIKEAGENIRLWRNWTLR
jgi:hypothetical protein